MFIKVRVVAGVKKEEVKKKGEDTYLISVREPAERNMANRRVCEIVASLFEINVKSVRIISGYQSPNKILSVNFKEDH